MTFDFVGIGGFLMISKINMINKEQLKTWLEGMAGDPSFLELHNQARVALVNVNGFHFTNVSLVDYFGDIFIDLGVSSGLSKKLAKVIWFLKQEKVMANGMVAWASRLAMHFKRKYLPELAGLFWHIKSFSKLAATQLCGFLWHRTWTQVDNHTNSHLEKLSRRVTSGNLDGVCFYHLKMTVRQPEGGNHILDNMDEAIRKASWPAIQQAITNQINPIPQIVTEADRGFYIPPEYTLEDEATLDWLETVKYLEDWEYHEQILPKYFHLLSEEQQELIQKLRALRQ
jgi:hypothetical protein